MRFQAIYDLAELCSRKGITQVVLCPGSRCAPLTLAFTRHGSFTVRTFSDERSAAFIAIGIARQTNSPVILICTSGTSVYNFAPAISEAYFSQTPLVVFTADRPREWIGQQDGQTIFQPSVFGQHVKKSFELPQDYLHDDSTWAINRMVNEAINLALQGACGPVHINAPFREPLYPAGNEPVSYSRSIRILEDISFTPEISTNVSGELLREWTSHHNVLVVAGQADHNTALCTALENLSNDYAVPVAGDIISNQHPNPKFLSHPDVFLGHASDDVKRNLRPDLLITFGKSVVSKNLKLFLRNYPPQAHWHIQPAGIVADTFKHLTKIIRTTPLDFFTLISELLRKEGFESQKQHTYCKLWESEERRAVQGLHKFFPQDEWSEFELVYEVIKELPDQVNIHLANSMSVRYANLIGLEAKQHRHVVVYANRGTSGIDGCSSTAVGHSLVSNRLSILITGDLAFFYDRNAFWHNYPLPNLRIVLLNNHGGAIFKMIDGPADLPESDQYFVTEQRLTAQKLCEEFSFNHLKADNREQVRSLLPGFLKPDNNTSILELETSADECKTIFENFKTHIKKNYEL